MKTIYKYPIATTHTIHIDMPKGSIPVLIALQENYMNLWMEVDMSAEIETRVFGIYGTGHPIKDNDTHIASLIDGQFVWHLYEKK